jgi:2'-5' RNA ligase
VRQFLAVELSREVVKRLRELQDDLRTRVPGWRWVSAEGIHLTLRFLGEVETTLDATCREGWRAAAAASRRSTLRLCGLGCFPPRGRPRVLWVGLREIGSRGHLARLAQSIESRAREAGFETVRRPFQPHLTLARAARHGLAAVPREGRLPPDTTIEVDRLTLFASELLPTGARYTVLDRWPVGDA